MKGDLDIERLILALSAETGCSIHAEDTLLIFDEIQEVPKALTSLKYFHENAPEYAIVATSSFLGGALHQGTSFPVGKVDFMDLYPLSFQEFLCALGEEQLVTMLNSDDTQMITMFKSKYIDRLRQYYYVGGMPEVVKTFVETKDYIQVREIQKDLLNYYQQDFSKHASPNLVPRISIVVYYGNKEKKWDGFCNLHEMLDWKPEMELWRPFINDYKIHVLDYHQMDDFSIFQSEIRQVFRFLKCCEKPEKLKNLFTEYSEEYYNMDEETYDFITELSSSKELIKNKEFVKQKDGVYNMCKGLTGLINEGKTEGKAEVVGIIRGLIQNNFTVRKISEIAKLDESYVAFIDSLLNEHPDWSDLQIAEKLVLQEA